MKDVANGRKDSMMIVSVMKYQPRQASDLSNSKAWQTLQFGWNED